MFINIHNKYTGYIYPLVAEAFFEREQMFMDIHHISGNALDNSAENLIYLTREIHSEIEPEYEIINKQIYQNLALLDWENILLNNKIGTNIVSNISINIPIENIFIDFPYRMFKTIYDCYISYDYSIGGSKDNLKYSTTEKVYVEGKFSCVASKITTICPIKIDFINIKK